MRILLATYWHLPHLGGVWPYMVQLKERLEGQGHAVDLLGYGDAPGTYVHLVNKGLKLQTDQLLPLLQAKLSKDAHPEVYAHGLITYTEFRRYAYELAGAYFGLDSYDVIHTQDVISTVSMNRIRPARTALVATLHGSVAREIRHHLEISEPDPAAGIAAKYFDRMEYAGATSGEYTILANDWLKNILIKDYRVPKAKIRVFPYGYDMDNFFLRMGEKSEVQRPPGMKVIIFAGRLVEIKGVHHLLDALGRLKLQRQDWVCWLVGDGDMEEELKQRCASLGLQDKVIFWGRRNDVPAMLTQADIFVLPSFIENQPLSVIEAQLAGVAIIVSSAGGMPEMVEHRVTGLVTPVEKPERLYDAIVELLDNDGFRAKLGQQAKKWGINHWSLVKMEERILDVYNSAIALRHSKK